MNEEFLQRLARNNPTLANNLAQRIGGRRMPFMPQAPAQMPVARPAPMPGGQGPVFTGTGGGSFADPFPNPAVPAQPVSQPAPTQPMADISATPAPMPAPAAPPYTFQMPGMPNFGGIMDFWNRYGPKQAEGPQYGGRNEPPMAPPNPMQSTMGMPPAQQSAMPSYGSRPMPRSGAGFTGGIGGLPFGSNMPRR